ncbi:hypothetical protein [Sporolactobacillus terrae]|uniref:Uncharacterized protein n=1 Tax=Sporolactobacillus terrae TaxID=269673 RepID=A0A5K7WW58_9BACL|nr:hypothetical protein [Sporolactobacillus terrae]BBN98911.1 hypothetical protein St703_16160 [Sporolactobacillus terrae]
MNKELQNFLAAGCMMTGIFLLGVNLSIHSGYLFTIAPLAVLTCASSWFFMQNKRRASVITSVILMGTCITINMLESPDYWWFVYVLPIAVCFPIVVWIGSSAKSRTAAVLISILFSASYLLLNLFFETRFFWSLFPLFAMGWWPLSSSFAHLPKRFAFAGSFWIILFFMVLNGITTPNYLWMIHPTFAVLWWPLSLYFAKKPFRFAMICAVMTIVYLASVNYLTTPNRIWAVFPAFAVLWWPLSVYYFITVPKKRNQFRT